MLGTTDLVYYNCTCTLTYSIYIFNRNRKGCHIAAHTVWLKGDVNKCGADAEMLSNKMALSVILITQLTLIVLRCKVFI